MGGAPELQDGEPHCNLEQLFYNVEGSRLSEQSANDQIITSASRKQMIWNKSQQSHNNAKRLNTLQARRYLLSGPHSHL